MWHCLLASSEVSGCRHCLQAVPRTSGGDVSWNHARPFSSTEFVGSGRPAESLRFRVTLDGAAPGADHGSDIDAQGNGVIREQRLYQLIRQSGKITVHTFRIEFLDAGAQAFALLSVEYKGVMSCR